MAIIHVVMFSFKALVPAVEVQDVCDRMLALRVRCVHPRTLRAYIKSSVGGKENSKEGLQGGITHVFVTEFASEEDRDYYINEDPAHLEFVKRLEGVVEKVQVVDFTPGVF